MQREVYFQNLQHDSLQLEIKKHADSIEQIERIHDLQNRTNELKNQLMEQTTDDFIYSDESGQDEERLTRSATEGQCLCGGGACSRRRDLQSTTPNTRNLSDIHILQHLVVCRSPCRARGGSARGWQHPPTAWENSSSAFRLD